MPKWLSKTSTQNWKATNDRKRKAMELTKQDKKHIQEMTRKLSFRIVEEANAYMHLYEKTYYEEVIKKCQARIDAIDIYHEQTTKVANNE